MLTTMCLGSRLTSLQLNDKAFLFVILFSPSNLIRALPWNQPAADLRELLPPAMFTSCLPMVFDLVDAYSLVINILLGNSELLAS